jgi:CRP-like cAMP-binding protein
VRVLKSGKHDEEEVARMGQGQYFGEVALIDSDQRSATVAAVERTELLRVDRQELEKVLNQDSAVGLKVYRAFARSLCRRLRQTTIDLTFMKDLAKQHSSPG